MTGAPAISTQQCAANGAPRTPNTQSPLALTQETRQRERVEEAVEVSRIKRSEREETGHKSMVHVVRRRTGPPGPPQDLAQTPLAERARRPMARANHFSDTIAASPGQLRA